MLKKYLPLGIALLLLVSTAGVASAAPPPGMGGTFFHDEEGDGVRQLWYYGIENAIATLGQWSYTTSTSGWYGFSPVPPGDYTLSGAAPADSWWMPTTPEEHEVTVVFGPPALRNFGYWWGLDPPSQQTMVFNGSEQMTFGAFKDATVHQWVPTRQGGDIYLRVRQPGVASALLQFNLGSLPPDAEISWSNLRLCAITPSNFNRIYLSAYPVEAAWDEATVVPPEPPYGPPMGWDYIPKRGLPPVPNGIHVEIDVQLRVMGQICTEIDLDPAVIAGWAADPGSNHGLIVRGEGLRSIEVWFASREHPQGARPQLTVGYDVP